jgi:hypothetical protein
VGRRAARLVAASVLVAVCMAKGAPQAWAQTAKQQQIRQLQADLARARTQLSVTSANYQSAIVAATGAWQQVRNGFKAPQLMAKVAGLLVPVARVASWGVTTARAYDAVTASIRAGRLTTTEKELRTLIANLEQERLKQCSVWVRKVNELTARLRALGVRNP